MNIKEGSRIDLRMMPDLMSDDQFDEHICNLSSTTRPYYIRQKTLIIKGIINVAKDRKALIGGAYIAGGSKLINGSTINLIYMVSGSSMLEVLWVGAPADYCARWKDFRNKYAGKPKRSKF